MALKKRTRMITAFLLLFAVSGFTQKTREGQELPSVKLKNLNGKEVDLKAYRDNGKITVISFWATWCKPCIEELDNLSVLYPEWKEEFDVEILAISIDESRNAMKVRPLVHGRGWEYEVLLDANSDTKRALHFNTIPYTVMVDKSGRVVYKHSGYFEGDEYALEDKLIEVSKTHKNKQ